ncbi:MAG: response regulator transcription factor [Gemmatimonadetes bacterium]|nr:response regulator transcription factor [Gemmatimonadota bacterium]MCB9504554.1 response regulator transcription factor [Gemmatimonadales bacterium]MCB9518127.1 response regulator transcription factor [Gemmatimonadales bacterium]HPF60726.1 response regulator transcription factor [Gemmatimonadales bacterium]HRX17471.1 response regulator transcription factor [Gemmatimonadales bacterium]
MSDASVTVCIADDHAVVREGIRRVLEGEPGVRVIGEASDGDTALELVERLHPEVLVVDVAMPGRTGLAVAAELTRRGSATRVLVLSMHDEPQYIREARRAGARGYLLKDSPPATLRRAVRDVQRGMELFPKDLGPVEGASPLDLLTPREREVLVRIARGDTNKEVAARLSISPRTVETHRESLMGKLGIRTVAGLTRLALEEGLLGEGGSRAAT